MITAEQGRVTLANWRTGKRADEEVTEKPLAIHLDEGMWANKCYEVICGVMKYMGDWEGEGVESSSSHHL